MPRKKRATNKWGHELVTPCQMQVRKENVAVKKIAPRRPSHRFSWRAAVSVVSQRRDADEMDVPDLLASSQGRHNQAADGGECVVDEAKRDTKRTYGAEFTRPTSHCSLLAPALGGGWMPNCPGKNRLAPLITDSSIYDHACA